MGGILGGQRGRGTVEDKVEEDEAAAPGALSDKAGGGDLGPLVRALLPSTWPGKSPPPPSSAILWKCQSSQFSSLVI